MKLTEDLASLVLGLDDEPLPPQAVTAAETVLIDHIAAGVFGSTQPASKIVARHALKETAGATGVVPLYGRPERLPAGAAARVNGTASHGFELDDLCESAGVHAAAVVIPAALAAAVERKAGGLDLLTAIVMGYEAAGRIGIAAGSQTTAFHSTGTHGVFGATAAVARIAGFTPEQLVNAWGINGSFSSALKAFQSGGGEVKRLHPGRAAENGLLAVSLAEEGLTGPVDVLENDRGFFNAYGKALALDGLTQASQKFIIEDVYFKPYSCCAATHPVIDSLKTVLAQEPVKPEDVDHVVVRTSNRGVEQNSIPVPTDTMTVQYSLESAVALALLGTVDQPSAFVYDAYMSSPAPSLASRVQVKLDPEPEAAYPAKLAGGVDVVLKDGRTLSAYEPGLREIADSVERREAIVAKFRRVTDGLLDASEQESVLEQVAALRSGGSPAELMETIGPRSAAARRQ